MFLSGSCDTIPSTKGKERTNHEKECDVTQLRRLLALALAGCSQSTAQADYIGTDAAKAIALEAAGIGRPMPPSPPPSWRPEQHPLLRSGLHRRRPGIRL